MENFSTRLNEIMFMRGISAAKLAAGAGISRARVSSLTNGKVVEPRKDVSSIASFLNVSEIWLLTGQGNVEENLHYIYALNKGELELSREHIRLDHLEIKQTHRLVTVEDLDHFPDQMILIISTVKKGDGLYLAYDQGHYYLAHKVDNVTSSSWTTLSDLNVNESIKIIGYVDAMVNRGLYLEYGYSKHGKPGPTAKIQVTSNEHH